MPNDLMKSIQGSQDRISKLLNQQTARYTAGDFLTSLMGQGTPIAQIAQKRRADQIQGERQLLSSMIQTGQLKQSGDRLELDREKFELEQLKQNATKYTGFQGILDVLEKDVPPGKHSEALQGLKNHPGISNDTPKAVAEMAAREWLGENGYLTGSKVKDAANPVERQMPGGLTEYGHWTGENKDIWTPVPGSSFEKKTGGKGTVRNYYIPGTKTRGRTRDGVTDITTGLPLPQEAQILGTTMEGSPQDFGYLTPSQRGKQELTINAAEKELMETNTALRMLETPAAEWGVGFRRVVAEKIGTFFADIGVSNKAGVVMGPSLEQTQAIITKMQTIIGRNVATVTGDDSGRYSDKDIERVTQAIPATQNITTVPQAKAALRILNEANQRAIIYDKIKQKGKDYKSNEGVALWAHMLGQYYPKLNKQELVKRALEDIDGYSR